MGLKLTTTIPMVLVGSNLSNSRIEAMLKHDSRMLRITTIYVPSVSLLINLEIMLNKNPNKAPKATPQKIMISGCNKDEYKSKDSKRMSKLAIEAATLVYYSQCVIKNASSKAVVPILVFDTSPSALKNININLLSRHHFNVFCFYSLSTSVSCNIY